jgi:hypothetical protein
MVAATLLRQGRSAFGRQAPVKRCLARMLLANFASSLRNLHSAFFAKRRNRSAKTLCTASTEVVSVDDKSKFYRP